MSPIIIGIIVIVVVLAGLAIFIALRGGQAEFRGVIKGWGEVAARTRLKFTRPETDLSQAELSGSYRHREMAVNVRVHSMIGASGSRQSVIYTQVRAVTSNPLRHFMRLSKKGGYHKTDRYLGAPYESTDDAEVDRRFDVKCIPPGIAGRLIAAGPEFRKRLLGVRSSGYVELEVEAGEIRFEQEGLVESTEGVMSLIDLVDTCAAVVEMVK
jgi:hypothetical protein